MLFEIVILVTSVIIGFIMFVKSRYNYWKSRGIESVPAEFPFGSLKECLLMKKAIPDVISDMYRKYEGKKYVGFYGPLDPFLLVRDPELIRTILVKEFASFHNQSFTTYESIDPLIAKNPFGCKGYDIWKSARGVITPTLTANKLKLMVNDFIKSAENMNKYIATKAGKPVEMKETTTKYLIDALLTAAFGLESDSFFSDSTPISTREELNLEGNEPNFAVLSGFFFPLALRIFRWRKLSRALENTFIRISKTSVEHRKKNQITRADVLQHVMNVNDKRIQENRKPFTDIEMATNLVAIYGDGVGTAALLAESVLFFLASESEVQEKLRQEVFSVVQDLKDLDLDKLNSMEYLDMVFSECLRFQTPLGFLSRTCTKTVKIDDLTIEKGTNVFISTHGLHGDPKYFPEPKKFKPERFSKENRAEMNKFTFLPFGEGPRMCLGFRLAVSEIKVEAVALLLKYRMSLAKTTQYPYAKDPTPIFITAFKGDLDIIFTPL